MLGCPISVYILSCIDGERQNFKIIFLGKIGLKKCFINNKRNFSRYKFNSLFRCESDSMFIVYQAVMWKIKGRKIDAFKAATGTMEKYRF